MASPPFSMSSMSASESGPARVSSSSAPLRQFWNAKAKVVSGDIFKDTRIRIDCSYFLLSVEGGSCADSMWCLLLLLLCWRDDGCSGCWLRHGGRLRLAASGEVFLSVKAMGETEVCFTEYLKVVPVA